MTFDFVKQQKIKSSFKPAEVKIESRIETTNLSREKNSIAFGETYRIHQTEGRTVEAN